MRAVPLILVSLAFLLVAPSVALAQVSHPASDVTPGSFQTGDYRINGFWYLGSASAGVTGDANRLVLYAPDGSARVYVYNTNVTVPNLLAVGSSGVRFSDGSIQTSAATSLWSQSGNDVYYNTGRVGVGTTSPGAKLHVSGGAILLDNNNNLQWKKVDGSAYSALFLDSANRINLQSPDRLFITSGTGTVDISQSGGSSIQVGSRIDFTSGSFAMSVSGGNVGIGTTNPGDKLEVSGNLRLSSGTDRTIFGPTSSIVFSTTGRTTFAGGGADDQVFTAGGADVFRVSPSGPLLVSGKHFNANGQQIQNAAKVGIGTSNPTYPLDVVGDVRFTGTLQGGSVPWARLTSFPAGCPAGQAVQAVGGTLTCVTVSDHHDDPASHAASGNINANGFKTVNLGTPTASSDAATKGYVDAALPGENTKTGTYTGDGTASRFINVGWSPAVVMILSGENAILVAVNTGGALATVSHCICELPSRYNYGGGDDTSGEWGSITANGFNTGNGASRRNNVNGQAYRWIAWR